MKYTVTKRIGYKNHHFQVQGNNLYECVTEANKLSFPDVPVCGICGSEHLELQSRHAQDKYKYCYVKCFGCGGELTFGQKMEDPNVVYLRKNEQGFFDWRQLSPKDQQ